jgi:hypothetical protein
VQANWRESRGFVEELDWRRQLDRLADGRLELPKTPSKALQNKTRETKTKDHKRGNPVIQP